MSLSVAIVTVNYNHGHYLSAYLDSLRNSRHPLTSIIVVDNASTDNSADILRAYPEVTVLANQQNIGYSAALNQAMRYAQTPIVCATGPDVVVEADWLCPLIEQYHCNPETTFAVASRVLTMDGLQIQSAGGSLHFCGHLSVYSMWQPATTVNGTTPLEVGAIDSTSVLFDREKFLSIGGCDPDFFVYHEEFDYCYRARMRGWTCWYHPLSVVRHGEGSAGYSVRGSGVYPRHRPFLHTRNRLLSMIKDYQLRTLIAILPAIIVVETLTFLVLWRMGLRHTYVDALRWLWVHRKETLLKRATVQQTRRVHDGDLLSADALTISPVLMHSPVTQLAKNLLDRSLAWYWNAMRRVLYL
ncbi:glycosyltransferase family 2 protein [Roseiflexus sp.]|uniref:glycosyltransferase family 2 protein n=1 Tax=Roseiflexus sp. TaxID=2562120 RepID=UPI00398BB1A6